MLAHHAVPVTEAQATAAFQAAEKYIEHVVIVVRRRAIKASE
ncbi:MAG TPA: hypothetical protein VL220_05325 [Steroidobacteraceae bacterium]|jgi:hypothetical protein|nr:hypothetical protein [Steroidobacteraceae bacterium]